MHFWLLTALMTGAGTGASAQSLDEIERQIEAAKREQAAKAAAEQREAEARAARAAAARRETEAAAAAAAAAEARMGTLLIRTDASCRLTVNGTDQGEVGSGSARPVKVPAGEQLIECASTEAAGVGYQGVKELAAGTQSVVLIELAAKVEPARAAARAERERAEEAAALARRFQQRTEGVFDAEQGVLWALADNGSDINWTNARSYCASKGSGWSLPTSAQLQSLYDAGGAHQRNRTTQWGTYTIKPATPLIRLTGPWFWSSETSGSSEAFLVFLANGVRGAGTVSDSSDARALCVRRP